jgi:hypothetical protein
VKGGHAEVYRVRSHVPVPGLENLDLPLVEAESLCCHTCWLGDFGALGLLGASGEDIVVGRWHSHLPSRSAWHPGPCWGWGVRLGGQGWRGQVGSERAACSSDRPEREEGEQGVKCQRVGWAEQQRWRGKLDGAPEL